METSYEITWRSPRGITKQSKHSHGYPNILHNTYPFQAIVHAWEDVKAMFNGGTRKRLFSESSSSSNSATPSSTTIAPPSSPISRHTQPKASKSSKPSSSSDSKSDKKSYPLFKPAFMHPLIPPPVPPAAASGYFPPFETCLDTFAAAAAALNTTEKQEKVSASSAGQDNASSPSSLGMTDYGLWPHGPPGNGNGFPFPYPFFWPSKRPQAPFGSAFHSSLLSKFVNFAFGNLNSS